MRLLGRHISIDVTRKGTVHHENICRNGLNIREDKLISLTRIYVRDTGMYIYQANLGRLRLSII